MTDELSAVFKKGDLRALSRFISLAENRDPRILPILAQTYEVGRITQTIGLTGPPGAGKSTLINHLIKFLRREEKSVAVVAIDPVSPFSGGALLGDRIRLVSHFNDPKVFIRSLSTRGKLGGLSLATREVVQLLSVFGFDYIIVETVGVGQSEVDVRKIADVTLVVLVPEWGDAIQTLKAGLLEIGDLFTVHKSDREGADRLAGELKNMLQMANRSVEGVWMTSQNDESSLETLFQSIIQNLASRAQEVMKKRKTYDREIVLGLIEEGLAIELKTWIDRQLARDLNPYRFALEFLKKNPLQLLFKK